MSKRQKTPLWAIVFWPVAIAAFIFGSFEVKRRLTDTSPVDVPEPDVVSSTPSSGTVSPPEPAAATPAPSTPSPPPAVVVNSTPAAIPRLPDPPKPEPLPFTQPPSTPPVMATPVPPAPTPTADPTQLARFKTDVIQRIEAADKDKWDGEMKALAKQKVNAMTGLINAGKITFADGYGLTEGHRTEITNALQQPEVKKALVDPNAGLVILGYADPTGSPTANAKLSKDRATAVETFVRKITANRHRTYALGVGQTNILNVNVKENRAVEIWVAIQPKGSE